MSESEYFKEGDVLRVKDRHRINLYDLADPVRQFYERDFVFGPSLIIVLGLIKGTRFDIYRKQQDTFSYKVLTNMGVGHIQAYTKDYQYSYYELVT